MVPTRVLLAAAVATLLALTCRAQAPPQAPAPPAADNLAPPVVRLLDAGREPRRLLTRTLQPGLRECFSATTAASSSIAIVDGKKYPPSTRQPITDQIIATVRDTDASGIAIVDLALAQTNPAPTPNPSTGAPADNPSPAPLRATLRLDDRGIVSPPLDADPNADKVAAEKLGFWDKKLRLLMPPLPTQEVGPGARWSVATTIQLGGVDVDQSVQYTLESIDADRVTLTATLHVASREEHALEPGALPEHMTGTITGVLVNGAARFTLSLDRLLPVTATDSSEVVLLSRVRSDAGDDLQMVQYLQNRLTAQSDADALADVEDTGD